MRHLKKGRKLSRVASQRKALLANLACSLVHNGSIRTTDAKAKELRPFIEKMVTFAKRGDVHARRQVFRRVKDKETVKKLFDEIGPTFSERNGGYTRIIKLGNRHGDNAPISIIEFVGEKKTVKAKPKKKTDLKTVKAAEKSAAALPVETPEEVAEIEEAPQETTSEPTEVETDVKRADEIETEVPEDDSPEGEESPDDDSTLDEGDGSKGNKSS